MRPLEEIHAEACGRKKKIDNAEYAKAIAKEATTRAATPRNPIVYYMCTNCGYYHLGHAHPVRAALMRPEREPERIDHKAERQKAHKARSRAGRGRQ